jgi:hypothetical protein
MRLLFCQHTATWTARGNSTYWVMLLRARKPRGTFGMTIEDRTQDIVSYWKRVDAATKLRRILAGAFVWDDDWMVVGDQRSVWGDIDFAVQFRRRPVRETYVREPERPPSRLLEDA